MSVSKPEDTSVVDTVEAGGRAAHVSMQVKSGRAVEITILIVITLFAAALRMYKLGEWSFWVDEMFTLRDSLDPDHLYHGYTYPLSYMLIRPVLLAAGVGEWTARLVPALVGVITPACIYLAARRSFGRFASLAAAAIIAISPWHLYWSQMARFYTMTLLFSATSLLLAYDGLERNSRRTMFAAGSLMVLGVLSHYSAFLTFFGLAGYIAAMLTLRWDRPAGLRLGSMAWFFVPFGLAAIVLSTKIATILQTYLFGEGVTGTLFSSSLTGAIYVAVSIIYRAEPIIIVMGLVGVLILLSARDRRGLFLACFAAVPALLMMIAGALGHAENRYAFTTLPAFALAAGVGVEKAYRRLRPAGILLAVTVPLLVAVPLLQHDLHYFGSVSKGERWDYRSAAAYVQEHAQPGQIVLSTMYMPLDYYLSDTGIIVETFSPAKIQDYEKYPEIYWLVIEDSTRGLSTGRDAAEWLRERCQLQLHIPAGSPAANYGLSVYTIRNPS